MKRFLIGLLLGWVLDHFTAYAAKEMTGWLVQMEVEGVTMECRDPRSIELQRLVMCEGKIKGIEDERQ